MSPGYSNPALQTSPALQYSLFRLHGGEDEELVSWASGADAEEASMMLYEGLLWSCVTVGGRWRVVTGFQVEFGGGGGEG